MFQHINLEDILKKQIALSHFSVLKKTVEKNLKF